MGVCGGLVVSVFTVLDCQSGGSYSNPGQGRNLDQAMMSTLTTHFQWEVETVRERTDHSPLYALLRK